jgi:hypothetical protein
MQIASSAAAEKRRFALAIFYDEVCRKEWSERASRGDTEFDVNVECLVCNKELLDRARIAFDAASQSPLSVVPFC